MEETKGRLGDAHSEVVLDEVKAQNSATRWQIIAYSVDQSSKNRSLIVAAPLKVATLE